MPSGEDIMKALASVRQGSGVVGKHSTVGCFAFAAMACGFIWLPREANQVYAVMAGFGIIGLTFLGFVCLSQRFAAKNPQLAGLESSDYVRWREIEAQVTKGEAPIVPTANTEPTALQSKPEGSQP